MAVLSHAPCWKSRAKATLRRQIFLTMISRWRDRHLTTRPQDASWHYFAQLALLFGASGLVQLRAVGPTPLQLVAAACPIFLTKFSPAEARVKTDQQSC